MRSGVGKRRSDGADIRHHHDPAMTEEVPVAGLYEVIACTSWQNEQFANHQGARNNLVRTADQGGEKSFGYGIEWLMAL